MGIPADFNTTLEIICATAPPAPQQQPQQQPGGGPITQEVGQEAESGEVDLSFDVS